MDKQSIFTEYSIPSAWMRLRAHQRFSRLNRNFTRRVKKCKNKDVKHYNNLISRWNDELENLRRNLKTRKHD